MHAVVKRFSMSSAGPIIIEAYIITSMLNQSTGSCMSFDSNTIQKIY